MLSKPLDTIDRKILSELQANAKLTNAELAQRVGLSPSPCLARVRALEKAGVVRRYVALLDARTVGLGVSVFIQVRLEKQAEGSLEVFEQAVKRFPQIMECYLMTGDSDYLLRLVVADVESLQRFMVEELVRIPGVSNIRSSFALKQVKFETALPLLDTPPRRRPASSRSAGP